MGAPQTAQLLQGGGVLDTLDDDRPLQLAAELDDG